MLEPGMVVSMEPMIMVPEGEPGAGGYREHDKLVVTEEGAENVTNFTCGPERNIIAVQRRARAAPEGDKPARCRGAGPVPERHWVPAGAERPGSRAERSKPRRVPGIGQGSRPEAKVRDVCASAAPIDVHCGMRCAPVATSVDLIGHDRDIIRCYSERQP